MTASSAAPLISIALCTYNGARYLREQLDSLLAQTHRHIEIIAVDDHSGDQTVQLLHEYAARDQRLRLTVNPENLGFNRNFQHAMSLCAGDYIAPCDQDDVWLPDKLEVLLHTIGESAMAYCDSEIIDEAGRSLGAPMSGRCNMISTSDPVRLVVANCVAGHAMLFRRRLLGIALPIPDAFYYDWWLASVAAGCGGLVYCDRRLVKYRLHGANVTNVLRERPARRKQGRRAARLRDVGLRLEALAKMPGESQGFLRRMHALWTARERQWLSPSLAVFMYRHWWRINAVRKVRWRFVPSLGFALGLRLKRLLNPAAYC